MKADIKKRAIHRAKIIEGQLRAIQKMIEQEEYCMDIITQNLAVQKSLSSLNKLLIENHARTHLAEMLSSEKEETKEIAVKELLDLYELTTIRAAK